jgi:hypothetical protein
MPEEDSPPSNNPPQPEAQPPVSPDPQADIPNTADGPAPQPAFGQIISPTQPSSDPATPAAVQPESSAPALPPQQAATQQSVPQFNQGSPSEAPAPTPSPSPEPTVFSADPTPSSAAPQNVAPLSERPKRSKKKLWLTVVGTFVVLLLLAAGYVFAFYLPNTPSHIYGAALKNSGLALDKLVDYSKAQQQADYKSASVDGTVHVKSPGGSYDLTTSGSFDKKANASFNMQADVVGEKINANVRSVVAKGNTSPDVYVQVSGIKSFLDSLGMSNFDSLNGQWVVIDHTLIDTYTSSLKKDLGAQSDMSNASGVPTYAQLQDALVKAQTVNKQYIFATGGSKAVLTGETFVGKETVSGRTVNHYKVGYNKAHLQAYVTALGQALDSSQLNDWSKQANDGKSLSKEMDLSSLQDSIKNAKSDYKFDLWVDTRTKLISKVKFTDIHDKSSFFTFSQNYTGGNTYPFAFEVNGKDSDGNAEDDSFGLKLNTATNKVSFNFSGTTTASDGTTSATGNFDLTPGKDYVKVTAPKNAKSITNILMSLGLGDLFSDSSPADTSATSNSPLI